MVQNTRRIGNRVAPVLVNQGKRARWDAETAGQRNIRTAVGSETFGCETDQAFPQTPSGTLLFLVIQRLSFWPHLNLRALAVFN